MTEKQGGSDVRANATTAVPAESEAPGGYRLIGTLPTGIDVTAIVERATPKLG